MPSSLSPVMVKNSQVEIKKRHPQLVFYLNIFIYNKEIIVQATDPTSIFVYFALVRIKVENILP